jgi:hypothetical protein
MYHGKTAVALCIHWACIVYYALLLFNTAAEVNFSYFCSSLDLKVFRH